MQRRNSQGIHDFGVFAYRPNTQNLRFWSFCGGRRTSDFGGFPPRRAQTLQSRSNYIHASRVSELAVAHPEGQTEESLREMWVKIRKVELFPTREAGHAPDNS